MNPKPNLENFIYALVIVVSLIALALVALVPGFMDAQVVYRGF